MLRKKLVEPKIWKELTEKVRTYENDIAVATAFVKQIEQGNLDASFEESHAATVLTTSLIAMRKEMKKFSLQDQERSWVNEGLAKFVEILRSRKDDKLETLSDNIIRQLVNYLKASQGALFLVNDDNPQDRFLEMEACYAYNRKKFLHQRIEWGEGLVGQVVLEKNTVYMTDVPKDFVKITSGLGESLPRNILLVPLKLDEQIFGVVEIASFQFFQPHQIDFVEKLGESIASTVAGVKVNERTQALLHETQTQAESMRAQEEEMRQNMEELSSTQEEMHRQFQQMEKLKTSLEVRERVFGFTTILSESDPHGTITMVNDKLCEVSKYARAELIGKPHNVFRHSEMPKELYKKMWGTIKKGEVFKGIIKNKAKDGSHYWVEATIVPVKGENGEIIKYVGARYHITDDEFAQKLFDQQLKTL